MTAVSIVLLQTIVCGLAVLPAALLWAALARWVAPTRGVWIGHDPYECCAQAGWHRLVGRTLRASRAVPRLAGTRLDSRERASRGASQQPFHNSR